MSWVDIALLGVLVISVLVGVFRGFTFEVLSLAGWFAAYVAATVFTPHVMPHIPVGTPGSSTHFAVSFAATFIAALIVWAIAARILRFLIHATPLNPIDRALGAVFGLLRGLVVLLAVTTVVGLTPFKQSTAWQTSVGAAWLTGALAQLKPLLPEELSQHLPA